MSLKIAFFILIIPGCAGIPAQQMEEWPGKTKDEVQTAFSHLTPKTERNKLTYRDSDPLPTPARCAVIPCYPSFGGRINCTYVFKFEKEIVVKASRKGNCR